MIPSPGTTIASLTGRQLHTPTGRVRNRCCALAVPYRCGIMIEHNWRPRPGFGSCIFLHVWDSARRGTVGCTAVSSANLEQLLHWLDAQKNPLIVQLPLPEYFRLRQFWELP